jgi:DNA modification methylase
MEICKIPITRINPAPYNPRVDLTPDDPEYQKLKKSIVEFGYVEPLVWNKRTGTLVSGHQRFKILLEQGIAEVEVSVVDLSLYKEKALNLALNKIRGSWDEDKLAQLLEDLNTAPEFNTGLTGFDLPEISQILDNFQQAQEDDDFDFDAAVESIKEPITKAGDIIELGSHRILCGDSASINDLRRLMQEDKANLIFSDPPYLASYIPGNRPTRDRKRKKSNIGKMIQNDSMPQGQYEKWLKNVFANAAQFIEGSASIYIWNGFRQFGPMTQMLIDLGFHISNIITWVKPSLCISFSDYNFQSEFCIYGWFKGGVSHRWFGPANESNVWEVKRDASNTRIHQNQKPIELARRAMINSSSRNDVVLDTFLGSGSSIIAAESIGRNCFGLEIDPRYCDAIVRRYIAFKGQNKISKQIINKYLKEEK